LSKKGDNENDMEPVQSESEGREKIEDKPVKDIVEPVVAVPEKASVKKALDKMQAEGGDLSPVIDDDGKMVGCVSRDQMNRTVGGFGHDPESSAVGPQLQKESPYCFEAQTIGEAEKVMRDAQVEEVPVVAEDKFLTGKATLGAIAHEKETGKKDDSRNAEE
jgi:CBS domain-containing protein